MKKLLALWLTRVYTQAMETTAAPDFKPSRYAEAKFMDTTWTFEVVKRTAKMVTLRDIAGSESFRALVRTAPDGRLYAVVGQTPTGPLVAYPR